MHKAWESLADYVDVIKMIFQLNTTKCELQEQLKIICTELRLSGIYLKGDLGLIFAS